MAGQAGILRHFRPSIQPAGAPYTVIRLSRPPGGGVGWRG